MPHILRIAGSFAIVLVAYWTYALVAVPLIEPPADPRREATISEAERAAAQGRVGARVAQLRGLFPPGAWELKDPKTFESERVKLLFQDYSNLGGGGDNRFRVKIKPCTVIFAPDGRAADEAQRKRQAVILEAPEGALLEFDEPFDLRRMKIGRLVGGELKGPIKIRSQGKKPGPEDDLLIVTRDVRLTEKNVWTAHPGDPVDFHYGPHYGRGRQLRIKLLPSGEAGRGDHRGPNIGGIRVFELRRLERLHLELSRLKVVSDKAPGTTNNVLETGATGGSPASAGGESGRETPAAKLPVAPRRDLPVEISCQGPFRFDAIEKVATFEDRVDVLRIHPTGPSDQLHCELLSVFFSDRTEAAPSSPEHTQNGPMKRRSGSGDLQPDRIEARGDPVVLSAPSQGVHARGQRLEYDLRADRIVLDGTQQVMLQQGPNEIHARSLQYESAGPGRLGRIAAEGPGRLCGQMDQRPDQQLEARWKERLLVRPHEENQVISLTGGAELTFPGIGQLDGGEIHFWLLESPPEGQADRLGLRPDRMLARDNVHVNSPEFTSTVEQLEVWFEHLPKGESRTGKGKTSFSGGRHGDLPPTAGRLPPSTSPLPPTGQLRSQLPARRQHFEIVGRLLRARVLVLEDGQTELSELTVEDGVQFVETQTRQPHERPLLVRGDRLHVVDADKPHAALTVTGRPAHFQGRGLTLSGSNINLNRGTNRLWIEGAGRMDLPIDRDLEGRLLGNPGVLQVHWQDRMVFDGRTARFEESVTATAPHQHLQTETLEVQFKRSIDFSDDKVQEDPKAGADLVQQLLCRGGVFMENRSFRQQTQRSHEQMQVADLVINLESGALTAGGPGWLTSVRRGSDDPLSARNGTGTTDATGQTEPAAGSDDDQLRCLYVRFQGSITGNILRHRREMTFHDQVHTAYAPVDSWEATLDTSNPDALGPGGVVMQCDRLSVNEMAAPEGNRWTVQFEAAGNIVVEGNRKDGTYLARAARMTYDEVKNLLILEGDGRTDAKLFRQQRLGDRPIETAARKIYYWPKTGRLKVEGGRSVEWGQLPSGDPGKR